MDEAPNWLHLPFGLFLLVLAIESKGFISAPTTRTTEWRQQKPQRKTIHLDPYSGKTFYVIVRLNSGHVNYVNESYAREKRLVYVEDDGKADDQTSLPRGVYRDSIRIESVARYDGGLFILDLNRAPWGCGVWPAFWTVGTDWPWNGEIDIIEGVQHNQVAWHTAPGCLLDPSANFTGRIGDGGGYQHLDCNSFINFKVGCGATEWSRASYGPLFDEQGGGVFAMKWDENGIAISVPNDIEEGNPNPSEWGPPSAILSSSQCDIGRYFKNHAIVFDITFCSDWTGNSYATSGCPGTCEDRLMDPGNFVNATWSINTLKLYTKQPLYATVRILNAAVSSRDLRTYTFMAVVNVPLLPYLSL